MARRPFLSMRLVTNERVAHPERSIELSIRWRERQSRSLCAWVEMQSADHRALAAHLMTQEEAMPLRRTLEIFHFRACAGLLHTYIQCHHYAYTRNYCERWYVHSTIPARYLLKTWYSAVYTIEGLTSRMSTRTVWHCSLFRMS